MRRSPLTPHRLPLTSHPSPSPLTPHPSPPVSHSQALIYNLHGCKDRRLYLFGDGLAGQLKNRRMACAHLYSQDAVHGRDGYRDATEEETAEYLDQHGHARSKVHEYYSLDSPKPGGNFAAATAAFLRLHERREEQEKVQDWEKREKAAGNWYGRHGNSASRAELEKAELKEGQTHKVVEHWVPKAHLLTKYKALIADLEALREEEPNMRVVIFTEYDEVQERLVDMLRAKVAKSSGGGSSRSAAGSRSSPGSSTGHSGSASGSGSASASTRSSRLASRGGAAGASNSPDGATGPSDSPEVAAGGSDSSDGAASASGSPDGTPDGAPLLGPDDLDGGEEGSTADGDEDGTAQGAASDAVGGVVGGAEDGAAAGADLSGLQLFEFNAKTAPVARHKRIKDFQGGGDDGAKIFIVTYRTAAVGITLTAANRVYLFEPALDPAQEVQAAGRIHRLGQTKEVTGRHSNQGLPICRSADPVFALAGPHQALLLPQLDRGGRG